MTTSQRQTNNNNALRPQRLIDYVGQTTLKAQLQVKINACLRSVRHLEHILLAGPPGVGKTTLAQLIAKEMGDEFFHAVMRSSVKPHVLRNLVAEAEGGILILDEIHALPKQSQEFMLTVLEDGYFDMGYGPEPLEDDITVIGATTEEEKVIPPLRDRFTFRPPFEPYSMEEMALILEGMGDMSDPPVRFSDHELEVLGKATGGNPRQARSIVFAARDLGDEHTAEQVLALAQLTKDGLTATHISYLEYLHRSGKAGLESLAASLRVSKATIRDLERVLDDLDMIDMTSSGRTLKPAGRRALKEQKLSLDALRGVV